MATNMKTVLLLILNIYGVIAAQPSAPSPEAAPLRDLKFGSLNFLHTTDTHGWHAGHLLEPSFSADWGDYIDFAGRLREKVEAEGNDLLVVDTGDRIEGNGLYDGDEPKGYHTFNIFKQQHIDIICSGNHELYKQNSSENELHVTVPAYHDAYLASNLDIRDPESGELIPLAPRYKKFTTNKQGIRIMAFGFLYDFTGNYKNTVVTPVEEVVKASWFQEAIRDREVDLFVVIGHSAVRSDEFTAIYKAIREEQWDVPIQFFGGHYHIRDYRKFDSKSYGLASGRFMETIGFQSIDGISGPKKSSQNAPNPIFFRRYIDSNLYSFYHHSGHNASTFHTAKGRNVSEMIEKARTELNLDSRFGCAPQDYWMSRAPYPANNSIYTWLEQQVLPDLVSDSKRSDKPRLILTNTGAIRFDIFKGSFTKDSTFIVSPFTSGFHYLKDVPYDKAAKVLTLINHGGHFLTKNEPNASKFDTWKLAPPEQYNQAFSPSPHQPEKRNEQIPLPLQSPHNPIPISEPLTPGYTTKDDLDSSGDDTIHSEITFYNVPNVIQSTVLTSNSTSDPETIDLVFNDFIQPYVLLALRFLGADYSDGDVEAYMPGESLTNVIARWVSLNWKC